jgi:hypothetical protein
MRRLSLIAVACTLFGIVTAVPAEATGPGWIDQLSGPGPFVSLDIQWRLACIQDSQVPKTTPTDPPGNDETGALRSLDSFEKGWTRSLAALGGAGCLIGHDKRPSGSFNFKVAHWWSVNNDLKYSDTYDHGVRVWELEPNFATFVDSSRFFEINSGAGVLFIRGEGFDSFHRFYLKPIQITIYPGTTLRKAGEGSAGGVRALRPFGLSFGILMMPKGMDATDFGAIPGTFHTDKEIQATFAVTWDLSRY